jgi:hypothetical protein
LPAHWLSPAEEGPGSRQRLWPRRLTFWTFLAQVLCPASSCRAAVRQAQVQASLEGRARPSSHTSPYCQARARLPLELLEEFLHNISATLQQRVQSASLWCGLSVKVLDGSTYNLPDTPANQAAYPQSADQKPGCGFPLVRLVRFQVVEKGFRTQWITLVTTLLDAEKYSANQLARLYRRRWQAELSLRQIKTALQMESLSTLTPAMAQRELLMHLLAYQLIRGLMQEAALSAGMELERMSFVGAVDAGRAFGQAMLRARSQRQRRRLYAQLLEILATDPVPERPGRREPRALKRRPKRYPRLNCPRAQFRDPPRRHRRADREKSKA